MGLDIIATIATSLAAGVSVNFLSDQIPQFAKRVIESAARIRYHDQPARAEMRAEEWSALISDRPGNLFKLYTALTLFVSSLAFKLRKLGRSKADSAGSLSESGRRWIYTRALIALLICTPIVLAITANLAGSSRSSILWWIASASLCLIFAGFTATYWSRKTVTDSLTSRLIRVVDRQLKGLHTSLLDPLNIPLQVAQRFSGKYTSIDAVLSDVQSQKRVVIVGEPGSGKTSLLYEIARQSLDHAVIDEHPRVPVLLRASSWPIEETLTEWLANELSYRFRLKRSTAYTLISEGGILLFLDGLDEVPHVSLSRMAQLLNDGLDGCNALSIIATCRTDAFSVVSPYLDYFAVINVLPLTDSEVRQVLHNLPPEINSSQIEHVFDTDASLARAARNPLLLRLLIYALTLRDVDSSSDPTWVALALGSDLAKRGDTDEALRVFGAAAGGRTSLTTTLADVLAGQLLARMGRREDADVAFERARAKYGSLLESLPTSPGTGIEIDEDQQKILRSLRMGVTYDESQIASISLLPPGVVQRALSALHEAGLVASEEETAGEEEGHPGKRWRLTRAALPEKTML